MSTLLATLITPKKSYCTRRFVEYIRLFDPMPDKYLFVVEAEDFLYAYNYHHAVPRYVPKLRFFVDSFNPSSRKPIIRIMEARAKAVEHARFGGFDKLVFLDEDILPNPDFIEALDETEGDVVGALVATRRPALSKRPSRFNNYIETTLGSFASINKFKRGEILEVDRTGHDCVLIRKHVFDKITYNPEDYITNGEADDFSFCRKAKELGYKIVVNTGVQTLHMGIWNDYPSWAIDPSFSA